MDSESAGEPNMEIVEGIEDGDDESTPSAEQQFDITLAASHSYMGGLENIRGRSVLDAGWCGFVPCLPYTKCVFPGETVPLLMHDEDSVRTINDTMKHDKLFALLCFDELGLGLGLGALCEVFEADTRAPARVKARAVHRVRVRRSHISRLLRYNLVDARVLSDLDFKLGLMEVRVLPEIVLSDALRGVRLASLDSKRSGHPDADRRLRAVDAATTPWPRFVFDMYHFRRLRDSMRRYFNGLCRDERRLPDEPTALSFWAARNLRVPERDRVALLAEDNVLLRLHMAGRLMSQVSEVCCEACLTHLADHDHVFVMSSDGAHSRYTNPGGHMHDIVTVCETSNTQARGEPSEEYSWFPGYAWTVLLCDNCGAHVGWRFEASRAALSPAMFYGLRRNYELRGGRSFFEGEGDIEDNREPEVYVSELLSQQWYVTLTNYNIRGQSESYHSTSRATSQTVS